MGTSPWGYPCGPHPGVPWEMIPPWEGALGDTFPSRGLGDPRRGRLPGALGNLFLERCSKWLISRVWLKVAHFQSVAQSGLFSKRGSILTSLLLVAEWTHLCSLKASHFVYLGWAKIALKWLKRVLCDTRMTNLTHPRIYGTKSDVLAG